MKQQATVTITGNIASDPDVALDGRHPRVRLRVINNTGHYDRTTGAWVETGSNATDVTCWGDLAHNVAQSVIKGDAVIVQGRLSSGSWVDKNGNQRWSTEVTADVVGHDLARGTSRFLRVRRNRPIAATNGADVGQGSHPIDLADRPFDRPIDGATQEAEIDDAVESDEELELAAAPF